MTFILSERQGFRHGLRPAVAGHAIRIAVSQSPSFPLLETFPLASHTHTRLVPRDPSQHASLKAEIEAQSSSLYATARLWDDGIIKPTETRDVVGLGLALAARQGGSSASAAPSGSSGNSWNVERGRRTGGFGVYRM